jgi:hypothetical protein
MDGHGGLESGMGYIGDNRHSNNPFITITTMLVKLSFFSFSLVMMIILV